MRHRAAAFALAWFGVAVLWLAGVLRAPASVLFVGVVVSVAVFVAFACSASLKGEDPWAGARMAILLFIVVAVPTVFDMRVIDSFNLVKFSVLVAASGSLMLAWAVERAAIGRRSFARSGLEWPIAGLVVWTVVATTASASPRQSLTGSYGSYDGLLTICALAVVFLAIVDSARAEDLPRLLMTTWFGAGGITVVYGLFQLHDRITTVGGRWDWIAWDRSNFPIDSIWSTFGNPNHLAGFLAVLLPIAIALFATVATTRMRLAIAALAAAALVQLIFTGTAGGWLGALGGLTVTAAGLLPELRARIRVAAGLAVVAVAVVVSAGLVFGPSRNLGSQLSAVFDLNGASTANQRLGYWRAAVAMASDRPLVGVGPDMYEIRFPRYQDAEFVRFNGFSLDVNGPHNTFLNRFASGGVPALAFFTTLVGLATLRAVAAWRRLRRRESDADEAKRAQAVHQRRLLAGITGGLVAFLVQASFNVDQVGLSILFWALLGMLAVVTCTAGVPTSMRPRVLLSPEPANPPKEKAGHASLPGPGRRRLAAIVLVVGALGLVVIASRPYRADRRQFTGARWRATAAQFESTDAIRSRDALVKAVRLSEEAAALNPWEPAYPATAARTSYTLAQTLPTRSADRLRLLRRSAERFREAVELEDSYRLLNQYAEVLVTISEVDPGDDSTTSMAVSVLRMAIEANPWESRTSLLLSRLLQREGRKAEALNVTERGLIHSSRNPELLRQAARLASAVNKTGQAMERWQQLLVVVPGDPEAETALQGSVAPGNQADAIREDSATRR